MRVDAQSDVGRPMPELPRGEDHVRTSIDEEAGKRVSQAVPAKWLDARRLERRFKSASRKVPPVQRCSDLRCEHIVVRAGEGRLRLMLAQCFSESRDENDISHSVLSLRGHVIA